MGLIGGLGGWSLVAKRKNAVKYKTSRLSSNGLTTTTQDKLARGMTLLSRKCHVGLVIYHRQI